MDRRQLLKGVVAGGVLGLAGPITAAAPLAASATRVSPESLKLEWSDKAATTIYVAENPDAPRSAMRQVQAGVQGGAADVSGATQPRPYYLLASRNGGVTRVAERLLPLKGGRNFRDLGGYRAAGGRQVRWGKLYRSGVMAGLTLEDMTYLRSLGLTVICDLRSPQERASEPNPFIKAGGVEVVAVDYKMPGGLGALARAKTREEAVTAFANAYIEFLDVLAPQYTDMFARMVHGQVPLAMNCTAGKDRTGVGSALVLSVLGVSRDTVVADYALSQVYTPASVYMRQAADPAKAPATGLPPDQTKALSAMPNAAMQVMMGSDPDVMRQALAQVDAKFGGPVKLAKDRFGLTDAAIAHLRGTYLV
jgi:protein-tyrosine phosphatase